jgi:hypothetical protein
MKKVRIILAVIAVLSIVGGALAFKAKRSIFAYCYGPITTRVCTTGTAIGYTIVIGSKIHYILLKQNLAF